MHFKFYLYCKIHFRLWLFGRNSSELSSNTIFHPFPKASNRYCKIHIDKEDKVRKVCFFLAVCWDKQELWVVWGIKIHLGLHILPYSTRSETLWTHSLWQTLLYHNEKVSGQCWGLNNKTLDLKDLETTAFGDFLKLYTVPAHSGEPQSNLFLNRLLHKPMR